MTIQEIIAIVLGSAGLLFMIISTIGILRLPDFYTRLHAAGIGDTLGALLILAAMMVLTGFKLITLKIFLLFLVVMLTNPMATNLIIAATMHESNYQGINEADEAIDDADQAADKADEPGDESAQLIKEKGVEE